MISKLAGSDYLLLGKAILSNPTGKHTLTVTVRLDKQYEKFNQYAPNSSKVGRDKIYNTNVVLRISGVASARSAVMLFKSRAEGARLGRPGGKPSRKFLNFKSS